MMQNGLPDNDVVVSDVDYRVIGLSPQYWSYAPLLIGDLIGLPLINGVDCFVAPVQVKHNECGARDDEVQKQMGDDNERVRHNRESQTTRSKGSEDGSWHIVPLSRVLLRGIATAVDRRSNGCTLIVLDDGTGSIDCTYWDDSHSDNVAFNLPPLLPEHETTNTRRGFRFAVGDSLEVMGKIKALTAGVINAEFKLPTDRSSAPLEVRFGCVREVHSSSVCLIGEGQTRMANQWNGEAVHWLKCMEFSKQCNENRPRIRNGKDILPLLGETISSSILRDESAGCSNLEKAGSDNVLHRKCCGTPHRFRSAFFYCHCDATLEALDPNFRFRDALLNKLLDVEAQLKRSTDSSDPSATEDCMDLYGVRSDSIRPPLLFTFESVYKDEQLTSTACEIVASTKMPEANAQRLVRKTFSALANDGILSLYDPEKDLYLLVSRTRVIEPFLKRSNGVNAGGFGVRERSQIPQPFFIRGVPKKRISAIMNWTGGDTGS